MIILTRSSEKIFNPMSYTGFNRVPRPAKVHAMHSAYMNLNIEGHPKQTFICIIYVEYKVENSTKKTEHFIYLLRFNS